VAEAGPNGMSRRAGAVRSGSYTRRVEERDRRRRLAWSTAIFSLATGLSRVLGLVREIVVANYFGARGPINAFTVAFQIPNLIRALVADAALSSAFVPVFSELLEKGERARAWRVASTLFWLLLLGLSAVTALFVLLAPLIVPAMTDAYDDLAVTLSQILFPVVVLLGVFGLIVGILNSYEHFSIPALTPVFWNLAIIAGLVVGVPRADSADSELYVYAGSIVAGTVVQLLLPIPWLRGLDGRLRLALDVRDPAVRRVFALMGPVTLGLGLINVSAVIGTVFAAKLIDPTIAPNAIDKAFRIYMLPQGMFSVAVATVLFPALSRLAARDDLAGFRDTIGLGVRQIAFLLVPASVFSAVLAEPIVRLVYERGQFDASETTVVAGALAAFSLGLAFNGMTLMLNRGFFGLQSPWTPTWVALGSLILNVALYAAFYRVGTWGIPLAISIANIAATAGLLVVLRRRLGRLDFSATARTFVLVTIASAVLAAVAYPAWWVVDEALGRSLGGQLASVGTALLAGGLAYLISCRLLGVRELDALLSLRTRVRRE
jgi:putative peptidoglycan lipid II flippase